MSEVKSRKLVIIAKQFGSGYMKTGVPHGIEHLRPDIKSAGKFFKIVTDVTMWKSKSSDSSNMQISK